MIRTPVLFLVFNRPETTQRVFEAIRSARPPRLYVSADGPRANRPDEERACEAVRLIATAVDWPCELKTQFQPKNLGCKLGEASGMDWFFEHEEEGIILEDDTLPVFGFFQFCEELLNLYRNNERVFSVSGNSYFRNDFRLGESYLFSHYADYWGWAGWRRSWKSYDVSMRNWPAWRDSGGLRNISGGDKLFEDYWRNIFDATYAGKIDTWDYQRLFTMWERNGVSILPSRNMVANLGFGAGATHTKGPAPGWVSGAFLSDPSFPLVHPTQIETLKRFDSYFGRRIFGISRLGAIKRFISRYQIVKDLRKWIGRHRDSCWNM